MNDLNNESNQMNENPVLKFLKQFISFDNMITPSIITFLFWLIIAIVILTGLGTILTAFRGVYGVNQWLIIYGLLYIIIGTLITKVFCEMLIVLFKINSSLKEIVENTRK